MFRSYRRRLFAVLFGLSIIIYVLSFVHILSGYKNDILVAVLILLISFCISIRESRILSQPIEKLNEGVKKISHGEFDYRLNIGYSKEFIELSDNFNSMARDLSQSYNKLKQQTDDLIRQNDELQEFNAELEASYEQLEALTKELEASEKKYRTLVDNMSDILWVVDKNFNVEFVNSRILRYLNYTPQELIGTNLLDIIIDEDKAVLKDMMAGRINFAEFKFISKEGFPVITETRVKILKDNDDVIGMQGISRDMSEYYNARLQIMEKNREMLAIGDVSRFLTSSMDVSEVLGNIAEKIADILKAPLCTIRTYNKETKKMELFVKAGELKKHPVLNEISLTEDDMSSLFILKEIKVKNIDEFPHDERIIPELNKKKVSSVIVVPLISKNETMGILTVLATPETGKSMSLLKSIASGVSIVIENTRLYDTLKEWYMKTIQALAYAVEAKDWYTRGHSMRVSQYAALIGEYMGLPKEKVEELKISGILHDIGKIGISDIILTKPEKLTDEEYSVIKKHPEISKKILEPIGLSKEIMEGISKHHERYDGKGYPYGLDDNNIPLEAAILCVADSFDAMTSDRAYRKGMSIEDAINELLKYKGTQFNPEVVDSFISLYMNKKDKIEEIKNYDIYLN